MSEAMAIHSASMWLFWCIVSLALVQINVAKPFGFSDDGCPRSCPELKPGMVNVHLVCHTHDDVGWLKTVDQYYIGSKNEIQNAGVQYILDSVIQQLLHDPTKRFIYVETAFFWRWWSEQNDHMRHQVIRLVRDGQLEFISGGWSMNDEGAAHYNAIIDQMTWGFRRLKDTFGDCGVPKIGWQIDPFGHSREQASLFAQMGFDGLFLGRIDYQDKNFRLKNKNMEFIWNASSSLGKAAELFTGILYNTYSPPPGFCFDIFCNDEPIQDNPSLHDYNVDSRVNDFLNLVKEQASYYATDNILMTMGNDFNYQYAGSWFKNLDKLIKHVNDRQSNGTKVNVVYSTPSCYLKALNDAKKTWQVMTDDFFPYSSDPHAYWTGYFTSRPSLKRLIRKSNNFLQVCKQLDALALLDPDIQVTKMRETVGVVQHHDAITGTAKQAVVYDYEQRISEGFDACQETVNDAYGKLLPKSDQAPPRQYFCNLLNISDCDITETSESFTVTIYNPIGRALDHYVRIPVAGNGYQVQDSQGHQLETQLVPIPTDVWMLSPGKNDARFELLFRTSLPALGFKVFFVKKTADVSIMQAQKSLVTDPKGDLVLSNEYLQVTIDGTLGLLKSVTDLKSKLSVPVSQNFYYYKGAQGHNRNFTDRASGVYIFRPNGSDPILVGSTISTKMVQGNLVQEVHQSFNTWLSQVIRLYTSSNEVEFEWLIGPIPVEDGIGKEVISRFTSKLKNEGTFYTDANGREILKRVRNFRPTWKLNVTEPVSGNYYPVNSRIYIKDDSVQLTILTDRSVGGSSLQDGDMEVMLHRRLLYDDAFGMGEPLNETGEDGKGLVVRGKTYLIVSSVQEAVKHHRELAEKILLRPWISFTNSTLGPQEWSKTYNTEFSGLKNVLPPNVRLLTLEQWKGKSLLLRLEHMYEKSEDSSMSQPADVDLQALFSPFTIKSFVETTLGANQVLQEVERLQWETRDENSLYWKPRLAETNDGSMDTLKITLNPMQIKTLIVDLEEKL